jgi:choline dehydrogenase-like flavoprotein
MNGEHFDVVVVGSGAGGGLVAGEVADSGADVLLLEAGPHRTAADFTRWEAHANHDIWFPPTLWSPGPTGRRRWR